MYRAPAVLMISSLLLIGCSSDNSKVKTDPLPQQDFLVASPPPPPAESLGNAQRFIASNDVPGAALDTMTGRLCKTYAWEDDQRRPQGLPLCSDLTTRSVQTGDRRAFLGYEYTFDGKSGFAEIRQDRTIRRQGPSHQKATIRLIHWEF
jgi:hypothetical protein